MNGRTIAVALAIAGAAASSRPASAQLSRWSFEGRAGATVPTGELSDASAQSGLSAEAEAMYTFAPNASVFAGLGIHNFDCKDEDCDEISSSGFQGGLKYLFAQSGAATPWLRGGVLVQSADVGDADSDTGLGFEAGGGIDLAVNENFSVSPSLRFLRYNANFSGPDLTMSWLSISLGAHLHLH
jgi:opacity protein-like surface antigen